MNCPDGHELTLRVVKGERIMKKFLCIILAITMMVSFSACGKETPEKAANNALKAVKSLNISKMEKYFGEIEVEEMNLDDISVDEIKLVKKFLSKTSWEILDSVEEGDTATVTVKITAVDPSPIFTEVVAGMLGDSLYSFLGGDKSEEELEKKALGIVDEMLSAKDVQMKTDTVELDMTLTESGWKINLKTSLIGSFVGSLEDLLS